MLQSLFDEESQGLSTPPERRFRWHSYVQAQVLQSLIASRRSYSGRWDFARSSVFH